MTTSESGVGPLPTELLSRLERLLGFENLLLEDEQLQEYRDPY
jgi:hypothetical protein